MASSAPESGETDSSFRHQATGIVVRREMYLGRKEIVALIDTGAEVPKGF